MLGDDECEIEGVFHSTVDFTSSHCVLFRHLLSGDDDADCVRLSLCCPGNASFTVYGQRYLGMASLLGETLFELSGQGPAPMKDYFHFAITPTEVVWSWWKISLRSDCRSTPPGQLRESHEDFLEDSRMQNHVAMVFGPRVLQYSKNLCQGHYDYIVRLPNALLFAIMAHLDLEDISGLSRTCHKFKELCNSEEFWEQTVRKHCDTVTPTVEALAKEVGWRTIFFTNKLQLQMQISRRKQKENQPCEDQNEPSSSSVPFE